MKFLLILLFLGSGDPEGHVYAMTDEARCKKLADEMNDIAAKNREQRIAFCVRWRDHRIETK